MKRWFALQTEDEMGFFDDIASAVWGCALRGNVAKSNSRDQRLGRLSRSPRGRGERCPLPLNSMD